MLDPRVPHPAEGKAGSLIRRSTLPPDRDPYSPDIQRRINKEAAQGDEAEIVKEYFEIVSASKRDVYRPAYEEALEDLLKQRIQTLYVAAVDRFQRRGWGQVDLVLDDLVRAGGRIVFVKEGFDSSRPNSRLAIAIHAELARAEAESISWRVSQFYAEARRRGLWVQRRPFGYVVEDVKLKPHPEEAPIVRRVVEEFLDGGSYRGIATRLNADGIPCPWAFIRAEAEAKGHRLKSPMRRETWSYSSVAALLRKPSLAALISHKDRLVYDDEGAPISCGEGIVTMGERARLLAEMQRRSTTVKRAKDFTRIGKRTGGGRPAKYLFSGIARCGHCHYAMLPDYHFQKRGKFLDYRCSGETSGKACTGAIVRGDLLEEEVVARLTQRLASCEPGDPLLEEMAKRWMAQAVPENEAERRQLEDALAVVKQTISDLWDDRYKRQLFHNAEDVAEWERRLKMAQSQRDAIQKQKDALGPRPEIDIGALLDTELSAEAWKEATVARKRELLGLGVNAVLVLSARRGQRPLKDRIIMVWAHEDFPAPQPDQEPPVNARTIIAQLVAEERAGTRPHVTGTDAAKVVGVIGASRARQLLIEERKKLVRHGSP